MSGSPSRPGFSLINQSIRLVPDRTRPLQGPGEFPYAARSIDRAEIDQAIRRQLPAAVTMKAIVIVVAVAMSVDVMVMAVTVLVTMAMAMAMPMPTGDRRAIDRQRGRAQRENGNRRHNELPGACHGHLPIHAARGSPCCDRKLDRLDAMRCDRNHAVAVAWPLHGYDDHCSVEHGRRPIELAYLRVHGVMISRVTCNEGKFAKPCDSYQRRTLAFLVSGAYGFITLGGSADVQFINQTRCRVDLDVALGGTLPGHANRSRPSHPCNILDPKLAARLRWRSDRRRGFKHLRQLSEL